MATVAGPSKEEIALLDRCERRMKHLLSYDPAWLTDQERRLYLHGLWYVRRDYAAVGQEKRFAFLVESARQRRAGVWGPRS